MTHVPNRGSHANLNPFATVNQNSTDLRSPNESPSQGHGIRRHVPGLDPGIKGRKHHIITDTIGLLIGFVIHSAAIQDRDGAPYVLKSIRHTHPWLRHVFATPAPDLIRGRLCRSQTARGVGKDRLLDNRDRQAVRYGKRLRNHPAPLGRGAHLRMVGTVPQIGKGLGENHIKRRSLASRRPHQVGIKEAGKILILH